MPASPLFYSARKFSLQWATFVPYKKFLWLGVISLLIMVSIIFFVSPDLIKNIGGANSYLVFFVPFSGAIFGMSTFVTKSWKIGMVCSVSVTLMSWLLLHHLLTSIGAVVLVCCTALGIYLLTDR